MPPPAISKAELRRMAEDAVKEWVLKKALPTGCYVYKTRFMGRWWAVAPNILEYAPWGAIGESAEDAIHNLLTWDRAREYLSRFTPADFVVQENAQMRD